MKKYLFFLLPLFVFVNTKMQAQTDGTLTFTFTQVPHSPCYDANTNKNALAVWIETNNGVFVKTKLRFCCLGSTTDHLPSWAVKAGGSSQNAKLGNITDAVAGATRTSFDTRTFTWDGKGVNGKLNGNTVADGVYKVMIEETWHHGSSTTLKSYSFTKGPSMDSIVFTDNADFKNVTLKWVPTSTVGIQSYHESSEISIFPNPNHTGIFTVNYKKVNGIKVLNTIGEVVYNENISNATQGTTTLNLANLTNGVYIVLVSDEEKTTRCKVILNK